LLERSTRTCSTGAGDHPASTSDQHRSKERTRAWSSYRSICFEEGRARRRGHAQEIERRGSNKSKTGGARDRGFRFEGGQTSDYSKGVALTIEPKIFEGTSSSRCFLDLSSILYWRISSFASCESWLHLRRGGRPALRAGTGPLRWCDARFVECLLHNPARCWSAVANFAPERALRS